MNTDIIKNAVALVYATLSEPKNYNRFSYPISKEAAAKLLAQAYRAEVESRGYAYTPSDETTAHLQKVARWLTDPSCKPSLLLYGSQPGTGKTTTARAVKKMAEALLISLNESVTDARESLRKATAVQFAEWPPIPWPEELANLSGAEAFKKQREWKRTHPEEAKPIEEKEAEKQAAIDAWEQPFMLEIEEARRRAERFSRILPRYITAQGLADLIKAEDIQSYNSLVNAAFLIIDDIGTEPVAVKNYGNEVLPFTELLLKRYDTRRPTIITTNLSESAIESVYGQRIMDRLNEICERIPYGGESYRH